MRALLVERPGLLTTVQDAGRWGWQHLGVSVSGWMDDWSARLANRLVGNDDSAPVLEVTLTGPTLHAEGPAVVAVTGAVFGVRIGNRSLRAPFVAEVADGEVITFDERRAGTRAYLAIAGGIDSAGVLGSQSTDLRAGLGGRRLVRGDRLDIGETAPHRVPTRELDAPAWLFEPRLRVIPGPDDADWTRGALAVLAGAAYTVATASDRTGYRLEGPLLPSSGGTMVSAPVSIGTIQVPPSGQPILLMADCQTTGGYARAGALAGADRSVAAQLGPGDSCVFDVCTFHDAGNAARQRRGWLDLMVESAR